MTTEPGRYKLEVVAPIFPVSDVKRSIEYYAEKLLFVVGFEWADASDEAIRYAVLQNGNCELHLTLSDKPHRAVAYFFVDGVIEYYEAVKARKSDITCEIEDHPWEMREFEVADPDGNRLIFGEHLSRLKDKKGERK